MVTKSATSKTAAKKTAAKKKTATPSSKGTGDTTLDNLLKVVRANGQSGISIKNLAAKLGVTQDTTRKGTTALVELGKVRREGTYVYASGGRTGRRSDEVVERDGKILANLKNAGKEGLTLEDVAEAVSTTRHLAYESVWRLRNAGSVQRLGSTRNAKWVAT